MTVPQGDPSIRTTRLLVALAVVGVLTTPALFLSCYLLAVHQDVLAGRSPAVVGMAVDVVVWSVVLVWLIVRMRLKWMSIRWWPLLLLVALVPFVVLFWMVFDLLHSGDPLGVWVSIAPGVLVPATVLMIMLRVLDLAVTEPPPVEPRDVSVRDRDRNYDQHLAVGVDADFWLDLMHALTHDDRSSREQGGVALTTVVDGLIVVVGLVLPQQIAATATRCEFSVQDVERVRDALDSLGTAYQDKVRITWLHTHPGLSVFLSSTDVATSEKWRNLDPDFLPIVVDIHESTLAKQIGVFGKDNQSLEPIGLVHNAMDTATAKLIQDAVLYRYQRAGAPRPQVFVGSASPASPSVSGVVSCE